MPLLSEADALYAGSATVDKAYLGTVLVWPPAAAGGTYDDEVLADSPVGYWKLDEASGTTAADSSGNGHDGSLVSTAAFGGPSLLTGVSGSLDVPGGGASAGVEIPDNAAFDFTGPFTVEAWAKFDTAYGGATWRLVNHGGDDGNGFGFGPGGAGLKFTNWGIADMISSAFVPDTGTIHHIVAVMKADQDVDFYVDGAFVATVAGSSFTVASSATLKIGYDGFGDTVDGKVAAVALYNAALTSDRIAAHYTAGTA